MEGSLQQLDIGGYACGLYLPPEYPAGRKRYPVVYVNGGAAVEEIFHELEGEKDLRCEPFLLLNVQPKSWNDDFTPWPAAALRKGASPFGGRASAYLYGLEHSVKPYIDKNYRTDPSPAHTALMGYSLGGLAALFALYSSGVFGKIGSMSGSLWFDGWTEYMRSHLPKNAGAKVYLSLGSGEKHSRSARMAAVEDCTRQAAEILARKLSCEKNVIFELNSGGHFDEVPQRFARALLWLMQSDTSFPV